MLWPWLVDHNDNKWCAIHGDSKAQILKSCWYEPRLESCSDDARSWDNNYVVKLYQLCLTKFNLSVILFFGMGWFASMTFKSKPLSILIGTQFESSFHVFMRMIRFSWWSSGVHEHCQSYLYLAELILSIPAWSFCEWYLQWHWIIGITNDSSGFLAVFSFGGVVIMSMVCQCLRDMPMVWLQAVIIVVGLWNIRPAQRLHPWDL